MPASNLWQSEYQSSFNCRPKKDKFASVKPSLLYASPKLTFTETQSVDVEPITTLFDSSEDEKIIIPSHVENVSTNTQTSPCSTAVQPKKKEVAKNKNAVGVVNFGSGNTKPAVPSHYMKTFNVKVPSTEIYPNTQEKITRMNSYDQERLGKKVKFDALKESKEKTSPIQEYIRAQHLLEKIQGRFETEYSRHYKNWTEPLPEAPVILKKHENLHNLQTQTTNEKTTDSTQTSPTEKDSVVQTHSPTSTVGVQTYSQKLSPTNTAVQTTSSPQVPPNLVRKYRKIENEIDMLINPKVNEGIQTETIKHSTHQTQTARKPKSLVSESVQTRPIITPILINEEQVAAGMKSPPHYHEKRHFPQSKDFLTLSTEENEMEYYKDCNSPLLQNLRKHKPSGISPPSTYQLARDLLNKAKIRTRSF